MVKKLLKNIKQNLIGFILGAIIFTTVGAYAATLLASDIPYTNNNQENVQGAIDDLYDISKNYAKVEKCNSTDCKKCKRATMLHIEKCNQTNETQFCSGAGYTESGSKGISLITYGNIGESGILKPGDAFDCDVNGDGYYNPLTERFYYVSEYYNTETKQFEDDTAVLIYYNNVSGGIANNITSYAYYGAETNYQGPAEAKKQLPTIEQWSNIRLKNENRAILNENGENTTGNGNKFLPGSDSYEKFAYSKRSARLLTYQEIIKACGEENTYSTGYLDKCPYLMENTRFENNNLSFGYWLETPTSTNLNDAYVMISNARTIYRYVITNVYSRYNGVRPAIEVPISDIEY